MTHTRIGYFTVEIQKDIFLTSFLPQKCSNINTCVCDPEFSGIDCSVRANEIWYDIIIITNIHYYHLYTIKTIIIIIIYFSHHRQLQVRQSWTPPPPLLPSPGPTKAKAGDDAFRFRLEQIGDLRFRGQNRCMIYNKQLKRHPCWTDPRTEKQKYDRRGFALTSLGENYRIDPLRPRRWGADDVAGNHT